MKIQAPIFQRSEIENLLVEHTNDTRKRNNQEPLNLNPVLQNLARNHSHRMSRKNKIWRHTKKSEIPKLIPNPIEATIAWTLITLGFLIAWIFALIGLFILWVGRKGYKKKVREDVTMIAFAPETIEAKRYGTIARQLFDNLSGQQEYRNNLNDRDLKLTGVGIKRKKNVIYATQIFYG
jgi:hypothetical protein